MLDDSERDAKLGLVYDQLKELGAAIDAKVTCPCGAAAPMYAAFKCTECRVWFCAKCAQRHFFGEEEVPQ